MLDTALETFPFLHDADDQIKDLFIRNVQVRTFPAGQVLYTEGDLCNYFAMVLSGSVRVHKISETGREITLYRVRKGECCFLTASCIMRSNNFPAVAIVEEEVTMAQIPSETVQDWIKTHEVWRNHIFHLLSNRLSNVASILSEVKFRRMDERLCDYLLSQDNINDAFKKTHQQIALEMGSAREVISRLLKEIEKKGLIRLSRGTIYILDRQGLSQMVEPPRSCF